MVVGGFVWVRLFELDRTCFGCSRLCLIVQGCVGLGWAVLVVISCSSCSMLYKGCFSDSQMFLVVSATFSSCSVVFGSFYLVFM